MQNQESLNIESLTLFNRVVCLKELIKFNFFLFYTNRSYRYSLDNHLHKLSIVIKISRLSGYID